MIVVATHPKNNNSNTSLTRNAKSTTGYYKFSVEEELFQYELMTEGKVSGCGGYGTLFPFVYGVIIGFPLKLLGLSLGDTFIEAASIWILLGQVNLYRRVNELCDEAKDVMGLPDGPVLWEWWALLPPPLVSLVDFGFVVDVSGITH